MSKQLSEADLGAHIFAPLEPQRPDGWFKAKCTYTNGVVAGYLAESQNDYVWLTDTFDQGYWVNWYIHTDGNWYLRLQGTGTSQSANRYLGRAGQDYRGHRGGVRLHFVDIELFALLSDPTAPPPALAKPPCSNNKTSRNKTSRRRLESSERHRHKQSNATRRHENE